MFTCWIGIWEEGKEIVFCFLVVEAFRTYIHAGVWRKIAPCTNTFSPCVAPICTILNNRKKDLEKNNTKSRAWSLSYVVIHFLSLSLCITCHFF